MGALLLRVGIDTGSGGCLAPILGDGSFEYIPIPEGHTTSETLTYSHHPARIHESFASSLPARLHNSIPHLDPEFETFTYGDPTPIKRRQLLKLVPGDLLVFYAGLKPPDGIHIPGLFIIGYFTVREVHDFSQIREDKLGPTLKRLSNNAHVKRKRLDKGLVIVEGDPRHSRLLSRALPLGDAKGHVLEDVVPMIEYRGNIVRAVGRWVSERGIRRWLDEGVSALVDQDTHLFSYVIASDTGFAPNVSGGYCTLACCKPRIRSTARVGDWVMGTCPKRVGSNRVTFIMRVVAALSCDEYFHDVRFQHKKPSADPDGDNIYHREKGAFVQAPNRHHHEGHIHHDTKADRVLMGTLFWTFGREAPEIPPRFPPSLTKAGPGRRRIRDPKLVKDFVSWVSTTYRPGVHGSARDSY